MVKFRTESRGVFAVPLYDAVSSRRIVSYLKRVDDWDNARIFRGETHEGSEDVVPDVRSAHILASTRGLKIYRDFENKIENTINPLIKRIWNLEFKEHSESQIVRYRSGGHYLPHSDGGYFFKERYFTVLCYLNDDFEGGDTYFPHLDYSVGPERGKAIVFPARYVHCAEPVIAGEKYVIVAWITGPTHIEWI
jgi:2OG-Fe(II) oxygenase superfamily